MKIKYIIHIYLRTNNTQNYFLFWYKTRLKSVKIKSKIQLLRLLFDAPERTRKAYWNDISHGGRKCYFAQHWLLLFVVRTLVNPRPQKYPLFRFTYKKDAKFNGLIYSRSKSLLFKCNCGKFPFSSTHLRTTWKGTRWSAAEAYPWDTLSAQLSWSGKD